MRKPKYHGWIVADHDPEPEHPICEVCEKEPAVTCCSQCGKAICEEDAVRVLLGDNEDTTCRNQECKDRARQNMRKHLSRVGME